MTLPLLDELGAAAYDAISGAYNWVFGRETTELERVVTQVSGTSLSSASGEREDSDSATTSAEKSTRQRAVQRITVDVNRRPATTATGVPGEAYPASPSSSGSEPTSPFHSSLRGATAAGAIAPATLQVVGLGTTGISDTATPTTPTPVSPGYRIPEVATDEDVEALGEKGVEISIADLNFAAAVTGLSSADLASLTLYRERDGAQANHNPRGVHWRLARSYRTSSYTLYLAIDVNRTDDFLVDGLPTRHGRVTLRFDSARDCVIVEGTTRMKHGGTQPTNHLAASTGTYGVARIQSVPRFGQDEGPVISSSAGALDRWANLCSNMQQLRSGIDTTDNERDSGGTATWKLANPNS